MASHILRSGFRVSCPVVYFPGNNVDNRDGFLPRWAVVPRLSIPHSLWHECQRNNVDLVRTWVVVATWITRCELVDSVAVGVSTGRGRLMPE